MMFGRLGILNGLSIYDIFNLQWDLLGHSPIVNAGASISSF